MKFSESILYQFYPLRLPGVPGTNGWDDTTWNGAVKATENRIGTLSGWIEHLRRIGTTAVYFSPVFQSDCHGYDTRDYYTIDSRLGTNDDFARLCQELHDNGIAVILDGVFNHTGRGFWAFRDVQRNREGSPYKDWYHINWGGNSPFNDGLGYEGWEGCMDLVKLNIHNPAVREHIFGAIQKWSDLFKIDGIRLDVAYSLDRAFLAELNHFTRNLPSMFDEGFMLIGETIHSKDYDIADGTRCHSCTNYELYKGLHSSLNEKNMFELSYSLNRQFGDDGIFKGKPLVTFADNHDVSRFATIIKDGRNLLTGYTLLFTSPGVPCLYYGSEWGITGDKASGDNALRPSLVQPEWNGLTDAIARLAHLRKTHPALTYGNYRNICVTNQQLIFERQHSCPYSGRTEQIIVAVNVADTDTFIPVGQNYPVFSGIYGDYIELISGENLHFDGGVALKANSAVILARR